MVGQLAKALNTTHEYLNDMGATVAPSRSYNFASDSKAAKWLQATTWDHIEAKIDVVTDFRYLGPTSPLGKARLARRWKPDGKRP